MLSDKIKLTAKDILEKDFKTAMRGYKPEDVDQFLDLVIKDYEAFHGEIEDLKQENLRLRKLADDTPRRSSQPATSVTPGTTNFDILKRISNLEKHVFGSKLYD
ncbi:cell division regulator GpsB [Bacillus sp. CECT 9360]|uniref:cell division regulator GpsB n=1 Tax=Bacillus sp. CECT 9360 TaxID=2845821 RepID=UPI001E3039B3|nr:cell division regulator GpsB [Bacillus sp. CECT 9360]CAH0345492.1 Cell cycle protein GpsB [Bacillus sp. CECT 9360]